MSSALTVAAVTAVLKSLLDNRVAQSDVTAAVGDVVVSALAPDRIPVGSDERNQLNLFLYRITPRTSLGPIDVASRDSASEGKTNTLSLDLHYILSAYGQDDFNTDVLLGCGIQVLHGNPILTSELLRSVATSNGGHGSRSSRSMLTDSGLAERTQNITVVPEFLTTDDTSKLWSAFQARYRPSFTYCVSSVPIGPDS